MASIPPKPTEPPVKKNAFVHKLYSMLSNPKLAHLIWWTNTPDANTFALYPSKEFADALSGYFKHGNVALFVRQLHMYGFHKVSEPQLLVQQAKDGPIWEFRHSSGKFKKDDEKLLVYIKRRLLLNSLRNLVVEKEQARTLSPLPLAFDHYQPSTVHYTLAAHQYPPVAYQMHPSAPYAYMASPNGVAVHSNPVHTISAANNLAVSAHAANAHAAHGLPPTSAAMASRGGPLPGQTSQFAYHPQGMMLPPPPPHDGRMYHVQWQLGAPVYAQYYPVPAEEPRSDGAQLKFRKPWELLGERQRNPSLLFDPLAPAAPHPDGAAACPLGAPASSNSNTNSRPNTASARSNTNSPKPDVIKLPPLGRAVLPSVNMLKPTSTPVQAPSPFTPTSSVTDLPQPLLPPPLAMALSLQPPLVLPLVLPLVPQQAPQHHPLPAHPWPGRPGLTPVNKSVFDKLRPSLIELHFPPGSPNVSAANSLSGKPADLSDSIGSHSLSIFSGISSILSTSSGRTSSFGSISHIMTAEKHRSVGPHESTPVSPQLRSVCLPSVTTIKEERTTSSETIRMDTLSEMSKPSTPLHKAKVEFLLDAPDVKETHTKRVKLEKSP